jgi:hypothetical protein
MQSSPLQKMVFMMCLAVSIIGVGLAVYFYKQKVDLITQIKIERMNFKNYISTTGFMVGFTFAEMNRGWENAKYIKFKDSIIGEGISEDLMKPMHNASVLSGNKFGGDEMEIAIYSAYNRRLSQPTK